MSVSGLKAELKFLASIFDKNHERFRIVSWKLDELHCQFLVPPPPPPPGSPHSPPPPLTLHCNITVRRRAAAPRGRARADGGRRSPGTKSACPETPGAPGAAGWRLGPGPGRELGAAWLGGGGGASRLCAGRLCAVGPSRPPSGPEVAMAARSRPALGTAARRWAPVGSPGGEALRSFLAPHFPVRFQNPVSLLVGPVFLFLCCSLKTDERRKLLHLRKKFRTQPRGWCEPSCSPDLALRYGVSEKLMEPSTRQVVWRVCELSHLCGSLDITRRGKEMLSSLLPGKNQVGIESWRDTWKLLSI